MQTPGPVMNRSPEGMILTGAETYSGAEQGIVSSIVLL